MTTYESDYAPEAITRPTDPVISVEEFRQNVNDIEREVGKVIVGQEDLVRQLLLTLLGGGNALLEGGARLGEDLACTYTG